VRVVVLQAAATALTVAAAVAAIVHVSGHLKSTAAPLHPAVLGQAATPAAVGSDGRLHLTPSVRSGSVQAVTSTYSS
jgi:hypothetical protein